MAQEEPFRYCDSVTEENQVHLFGNLYLPLFVGRVTYREYLPTELSYRREEAGELLGARLYRIVHSLEEKGVQIIQKDVKIETDTKNYILKGNFTVLSKAVESIPMEEEESIQPETITEENP